MLWQNVKYACASRGAQRSARVVCGVCSHDWLLVRCRVVKASAYYTTWWSYDSASHEQSWWQTPHTTRADRWAPRLAHVNARSRSTTSRENGPVHNGTLFWFESLILPFVNAKLFQIRLLKHVLKREKKEAFWIVIRVESLILRPCERKALSERDSCVRILEMRTEAMHGSISADCAVGTKYYLAVRRSCLWLGRRAFAMLVNARSLNHNPNHEADRDPKLLSFLCEQAHCQILTTWHTSQSRDWATCAHVDVTPASQYRSRSRVRVVQCAEDF